VKGLTSIQSSPRSIELEKVERESGPYCMSFEPDLHSLFQSVKMVGVLNPPILLSNERDRYDVVTGFRRLEVLRELKQKRALCVVLPDGARFSPLDCFRMALFENLTIRRFNEVERAMILTRLLSWVPRDEVVSGYMPLLGLSPRESLLDFYLSLESLERPILVLLSKGLLSIQTARQLLRFNEKDRLAAAKWISNLKLNTNQQVKFIEYIEDISIKHHISIYEILDREPFAGLLQDGALKNIPQQAKRVMRLLREMRFPRLSRIERSFKKKLSRIPLPEGVKITPPSHFEANEYKLEIGFEDLQTLKRKIKEFLANEETLEDMERELREDP